jgi:integrase
MEKSILFLKEFELFIRSSKTGRRRMPSGKKITKGTLTQYQCVQNLIRDFEYNQSCVLRIVPLKRNSARQIQKEKLYWKSTIKSLLQYLYRDRRCYDNYVSGVLKVIRSFFRYIEIEKSIYVGAFYKAFRVPSEVFAPVVLTPDQLRFLICDRPFENSLTGSLKNIKDIFVFGCTVGLRFGDLMKLKQINLQKINEEYILITNTQKTGVQIRINLPNYAIDILKRHRKNSKTYLLPRISNTNFNIQVKNLARKAGWDYYFPKIRHRLGKSIEIKTNKNDTYRFYHHITAHSMRRTAITCLLMLGLEEHIVRRISGHAPGSKEFYRYVNISQDYLNDKLKDAYQRLVEDRI